MNPKQKNLPLTTGPLLLIEEDSNKMEFLSSYLNHHNLSTIPCSSGYEAISICKTLKPEVAVLDPHLPDMDGFTLLKKLKQQNPRLRIIIHTQKATFDEVINALNLGAFAYTYGNEDMDTLKDHINRAFESDQLKLQKTLIDAKQEVENLNQIKTEFLQNISHELRNPMHGILGFAQLGLKNPATDHSPLLQSYFKKISDAGTNLMSYIENLIDLSEQNAGNFYYRFEEMNLIQLLDSIINHFKFKAHSKGIKIFGDYSKKEQLLYLDVEKISQVLKQIFQNSIQYSHGENQITLSLDERKDKLILSIKDHGIGVPEAELKSIFNNFTQSSLTKDGSGGKGLGLSISKHIIEDHGGEIWAERNADKGVKFVIQFSKHFKGRLQLV